MRRIQSARTQPAADHFNVSPRTLAFSCEFSGHGQKIDQRSLIEQRQKISQQILFTKSQIAPLRQKAAELSGNLSVDIDGEYLQDERLEQLNGARRKIDNDLRLLKELISGENVEKLQRDIQKYRVNLSALRENIQKGKETLIEKRNAYDVIVHSEIYAEITDQRALIEELSQQLSELVSEGNKINDNVSLIISEVPEISKLNQKVLFLQKRLSSLQYDKFVKKEELNRLTNNSSSKRSPRAKSRRKMNSDIEMRMKSRRCFITQQSINEDRLYGAQRLNENQQQGIRSLKRFNSNSDLAAENLDELILYSNRNARRTNSNNSHAIGNNFYDQMEQVMKRNQKEIQQKQEKQAREERLSKNPDDSLEFAKESSTNECRPKTPSLRLPRIAMPSDDPSSLSPRLSSIVEPMIGHHEKSPRVVRFVFEDAQAQMQ